jgi:hypothetical protein
MTRPCSPAEAVARALSMVDVPGPYILGTGDYNPSGPDVPWTERDGLRGSDCAGFAISWCYKLPRHRPGYNIGPWSSVSDDLNCNSAIEDAEHARELFTLADGAPQVGDLIAYPTIRLAGHVFIGHVCIVVGVGRAGAWSVPDYSLLDVVHCHGPNGRKPACTRADGAIWNQHDHVWPKPEHRSRLLRAVEM